MKQNLLASLALLLIVTFAFGVDPCWDSTNTCGDLPACGPNAGQEIRTCLHKYCDRDTPCDPTSTQYPKRVRQSDRKVFSDANGSGTVRECVGAATCSNTNACCNCIYPGEYSYPVTD